MGAVRTACGLASPAKHDVHGMYSRSGDIGTAVSVHDGLPSVLGSSI
ncbi:Uncharacterised protein [Mycobacteroides abscessus subsp. massiliense]|nr:Uncharacterised protein [Mycobacteroides abscessus subsp. massiliense]SKG05534.1 Uncharacterised protein [Mycobacteroides abscessus subsp. massiliense]SKG23706.1 Uncharacterised protein [Mycobacteroides abscessus subsp. massiliense]SKG77047.1 Uncharacterised protein [Mycobacteroides abscessus subsp. massiliense]SKH64004.1 Uncharacterised protein [Mycobacteroides abscessus subsp. massiliense]